MFCPSALILAALAKKGLPHCGNDLTYRDRPCPTGRRSYRCATSRGQQVGDGVRSVRLWLFLGQKIIVSRLGSATTSHATSWSLVGSGRSRLLTAGVHEVIATDHPMPRGKPATVVRLEGRDPLTGKADYSKMTQAKAEHSRTLREDPPMARRGDGSILSPTLRVPVPKAPYPTRVNIAKDFAAHSP
jgi:hypothetical protein